MRYLMTRPYGEVVKLMNVLSALSPLDPRIGADFIKASEEKNERRKG